MQGDESGGGLADPSGRASGSEAVGDRRRGGRQKWLVIGTIALALLVLIGYVVGGAAAAAAPVSRADAALQATLSHDQSIGKLFSNDPFSSVNFNSSDQDVAAARAALTKAKGDVAQWQSDVINDRRALMSARADLDSSLLTLPEQGTISSHRKRVDAALRAMSDAQQGITLISKQLDVMGPFFEAIAGFIAISKAADAHDLSGLQKAIAATSPNVDKTVSLGKAASFPPPMMTILTSMQQMLGDMKGLVAAAQAGDQAGTQKYAAAIDTDAKALDAADQTTIDAAEKKLFQPLSDDYEAQMKTAAG